MANVLITGIDGFVGSHLAEALLSLPNIQLYGITRPNSSLGFVNHLHDKIVLENVDITNPDKLNEVISKSKPDKIFHLAGQAFVPKSMEDPRATFDTNVTGTLNVLESVRQYVKQQNAACSVLFISSGEVYGNITADQIPIDEQATIQPANPYAASKAAAELIAQQYRTTFGLEVYIARSFNHLGPRQSELFVGSAFAKQIAEIKLGIRAPKIMVGNLDPERDFTDARDVVQAYIKILEKPRQQYVYNVCSEHPISIRTFLTMLCELAGVKVEIVPDPNRQRRNDIPKIVGSAARLRAETGWKPKIPLKQTLQDLLNYWESRVSKQ